VVRRRITIRAVAAAYGWDPSAGSEQGLDQGHGFHEVAQGVRYTISESARCEVFTRLLALNRERYADEVRQGLHEKKKETRGSRQSAKAKRKRVDDTQLSLF
jgi:hypothetical protein